MSTTTATSGPEPNKKYPPRFPWLGSANRLRRLPPRLQLQPNCGGVEGGCDDGCGCGDDGWCSDAGQTRSGRHYIVVVAAVVGVVVVEAVVADVTGGAADAAAAGAGRPHVGAAD